MESYYPYRRMLLRRKGRIDTLVRMENIITFRHRAYQPEQDTRRWPTRWTFRLALSQSQVEDLCLTLSQMSVSHVRHAPRKLKTNRMILVSVDRSQKFPVGLQVMCWRLQEEKVLALVKAIKESLVQTYNHGVA